MKVIGDKKFYRPMEIATLGLIKSAKGDDGTVKGHYDHILRLIQAGRLNAVNTGTSDYRPYYLVSEDEIKRYNRQLQHGVIQHP